MRPAAAAQPCQQGHELCFVSVGDLIKCAVHSSTETSVAPAAGRPAASTGESQLPAASGVSCSASGVGSAQPRLPVEPGRMAASADTGVSASRSCMSCCDLQT